MNDLEMTQTELAVRNILLSHGIAVDAKQMATEIVTSILPGVGLNAAEFEAYQTACRAMPAMIRALVAWLESYANSEDCSAAVAATVAAIDMAEGKHTIMPNEQERKYPRKWFRVGRGDGAIREREFTRETDQTLFYNEHGCERREAITSKYHTWYPTREAAEKVVAVNAEAKKSAATRRRLERAAPAMFEALNKWIAYDEGDSDNGVKLMINYDDALAATKAAIALVEGDGG